MSHAQPRFTERKSLWSVQSIRDRNSSVKIPPSHMSASLKGSAASCVEIGNKFRYSFEFMRATVCIWFALNSFIPEFYSMASAFQEVERFWSLPDSQKIWTDNATRTVKAVQRNVQQVATSLQDIADSCKAWTVVVPDLVFYRLQRYQIWLQREQLILYLLVLVLYVLSPSGKPNLSYCHRHKDNISFESEMFSTACQCLACTILLRQEIKEKLLKIASMDPKDKDIVINATEEEMPDADDWSSLRPISGILTPIDDRSDAESDSSSSSSPSRSSPSETVRECHCTDPTEDRQSEDSLLEAILDGFEVGKSEPGEESWSAEMLAARRADLAKLAFHWTNVDNFAGIRRADPTLA